MKIIGVIPARYGSTRFPGKPLALIRGKSMIEHVYRGCGQSTKLSQLVVATDDRRIADHVLDFGGKAIMTSSGHVSGTSRCEEACRLLGGADWCINIQGDEPLIRGKLLDDFIGKFAHFPAEAVLTLVRQLREEHLIYSPNTVKCVRDRNDKALYFSRSVIPHPRSQTTPAYYQHIGIYAYPIPVLKAITGLEPTPLEQAESLEQLRWMEHGFPVYTFLTDYIAHGVDVPEDIGRIEEMMGRQ
ncbi:MAG TPA: 3-deoxy-manno-octulosonate cytidylyltransferase [Saprospiraceae bacterium]|nr:3-deoxy-manno-octulosonate cytidylyltransferase [Saprospiraceae bacterium]